MDVKIILILFLIVILGSCSVKYECEEIEKDLFDFIQISRNCRADSDCFIISDGIVLGCYYIVSKNIDQETYNNILSQYSIICPSAQFKCATAPNEEQIKCEQNICIDVRFEK